MRGLIIHPPESIHYTVECTDTLRLGRSVSPDGEIEGNYTEKEVPDVKVNHKRRNKSLVIGVENRGL